MRVYFDYNATTPLSPEAAESVILATRDLFGNASSVHHFGQQAKAALDDARSYFASQGERFGLILSEPSNPWVAGVSGLFTSEFYAHVRRYLTPDGVFGQWLHLSELNDGLALSVVRAVAVVQFRMRCASSRMMRSGASSCM